MPSQSFPAYNVQKAFPLKTLKPQRQYSLQNLQNIFTQQKGPSISSPVVRKGDINLNP